MSTNVIADIQLILNDSGVFWPTQQLYDAVNEAQFHIYAETKWALATQAFVLTSGVDIISIPSNILIPRWLEGTNTQFQPAVVKRFFPTTQRNLEAYLRTWKGDNTGQPMYFSLWDSTHWRVYPRPDNLGSGPGGVYPFTIFGIGLPNEINGTNTSIPGPSSYSLAVKNYSVALLLEATRPDLGDMYMTQAETGILNFKKRLRNNQSHNIRTLKPATTRFELDQAGIVNELPAYYPLES